MKTRQALITGASKGIGKAIKNALKKEGIKCIDWSRTNGIDLMKGPHKFPEVDILINNVGGMGTAKYKDSWDCIKKNLGITHMLTYVFVQNFIKSKKKRGRVITISSIQGKEFGGTPWFSAAKAGQIALMKNYSKRVKECTFNTVCPGHIDVGKPFPYKPKVVGKPEDVANLVSFLCSDKANHINGATITVDGGESHSY